jgi:hypothetical protein
MKKKKGNLIKNEKETFKNIRHRHNRKTIHLNLIIKQNTDDLFDAILEGEKKTKLIQHGKTHLT